MRRKKGIGLVIIGSLILSLAGCGGQTSEETASTEEIELLEPAGVEMSYEEAQIRNLYDYEVYAAAVIPYIEEYTPENAMYFEDYGAYPGETVKKGQELITSNTDALEEEIEKKQEYIASMEEEYQKYVETQTKKVTEYRGEEKGWKYYVDLNEQNKPEEFILIPSETNPEEMVEAANPEYAAWEKGYNMVTGRYRITKHAADTLEMQMEQRRELYELDLAHQQYLLKELQERRRSAGVEAGMDGTVVAIKDFFTTYNNYIGTDQPVAAVADLSIKRIRCNYIPASSIKKAEDVYAVINGKRYEVEFQEISPQEQQEIVARGNKVYSTFTILDGTDEVKIGDYAVIMVIASRHENVVAIPKEAVRKDDSGSYVYVIEDGQNVYTGIRVGYNDGNYVEITEGLKAGDKVACTGKQKAGSETIALGKGDFYTDFSGSGWMEYPSSHYLTNPVENGTVYFGEAKTKIYQHVDKGDVIATVRVEADDLALAENETRLSRLQERLADFKKNNEGKEDQDYYLDTVESYEEQIGDLTEKIAKQKKDFATTQIVADRTGVIVEMHEYEKEDIVQSGAEIVRIADETTCYILVEDSSQNLQFGNSVQVTYRDSLDQRQTVEGMVASMSRLGVSSALAWDYTFILLPPEQIKDMMQTADPNANFWNRMRYTVSAKLRSMKNVILVPRRAVYELGGKTYVYLREENGGLRFQSFVSGGSNNDYFMAIEGLTEGMEVCLK